MFRYLGRIGVIRHFVRQGTDMEQSETYAKKLPRGTYTSSKKIHFQVMSSHHSLDSTGTMQNAPFCCCGDEYLKSSMGHP